ncbi:MAG TPA: FHIPEP family type III secretion protein, partial [Rhizobiaceae bacterium]|nr:FHIPEP family type III secretion protein [Rhizobiaceae bacterium]
KDAAVLAERVRIALKRQITFRVANRDNIVAAYVLQPSAEEALRAAVQTTPAGAFVNPSSDDVQAILEQIEQTFSQASADTAPVVLTAVDIRRHLRSLLMQKKIELPVLSYQELAPEFSVQPLATITTRRAHGADRQPRALPATQAPIP